MVKAGDLRGSGSFSIRVWTHDDKNCCPLIKEYTLFLGNGIRKGRGQTLAMLGHTEAHYDVQEVEMGEVYARRPESIVVESDCGERLTLTAPTTTCDADHKAGAEEG
jgi:hypothetical protein